MKKNNYYTKSLIEAFENGASDVIDLLINHPEIDWDYHRMLMYATMFGNIDVMQKAVGDKVFVNGEFLNALCNGAVNGKLDNIKFLIERVNQFKQTEIEYYHALKGALRHAGENNHQELFDYLLSLKADPTEWWVTYWITKKAKKPMYDHLMKNVFKLEKSPSKKSVIEYCEKIKYKPINIEELRKL